MPRPSQNIETVVWTFEVPTDLATKIDLLLLNPMTGRVKYGARKQLFEMLFRRWLEQQIGKDPEEAGFEPDSSRYAGKRRDQDAEDGSESS